MHYPVIICGAGPVGLLTALALGQAGIKTLLIERNHELPLTTRAAVYMPVALSVLHSLGILQQVKEAAYLNREGINWRDKTGAALGHLRMCAPEERLSPDQDEEGEYVLVIGQGRLGRLLLQEISKLGGVVEVKFGLECVGVEASVSPSVVNGEHGQSKEIARLMIQERSTGDDLFLTANWVLGTDGANSIIRRSLCIPFEGFSFNSFRMVGTDVLYDFKAHEYGSILNFIVDPEDWAVVCYTGEDEEGKPYGKAPPVWRVAYSENVELDGSQEAVLARAKERVKTFTKGKEVRIRRAEKYTLRQRCAREPGKGRVFLAGDALHVSLASKSTIESNAKHRPTTQ
jgi:2-polyprenyl-6-methoxyphenol hydroxylase-like FAD-dependent oxidoreductase